MISVVIVNYNTWELTRNLSRSILDTPEYPDIEVVVVDNQSREKAPTYFHDTPQLKLIENQTNLGFAHGVNTGTAAAKNELICVLNSDIILEVGKPFFKPLAQRLKLENSAMVSPKIVFQNNNVLQFAGFTPINKLNGRGFAIGYHQKDEGQYDCPKIIPRAHGAAMMFKKSVWEAVGGIPELYFLYYEEMDFSELIRNNNYEIWYEPAAQANHIGSYSILSNATPKFYYIFRNRIWYLRRHTRWYHLVLSLPYMGIMGFIKTLFQLAKGQFRTASYIARGTIHGIFKSWK